VKTTKIRIIAYVTFGVINLIGFVYLVGEDRYRVSTAAPDYPQDLSSWLSGRLLNFPLQPADFPLPSLLFYGEESLD
jgi:hypothetical protein